MAEAGLPTELQSMSPMCYGALELFRRSHAGLYAVVPYPCATNEVVNRGITASTRKDILWRIPP